MHNAVRAAETTFAITQEQNRNEMGSRRRSKRTESASQSPSIGAGNSVDAGHQPGRIQSAQDTGGQPPRGPAGAASRRRRLVFERLGQRRVLAVVTGEVFLDPEFSLRSGPSEVRLESRLAYLDANDNGQFDSGEAYSITDSEGRFRFEDVPEGTHSIRLYDGSSGQRQTFPASYSQKRLGGSFSGGLGANLIADTLQVLTTDSLLQIDTAGTRSTKFDLDFDPTNLLAAFSAQSSSGQSHPNAAASLVVGTFNEGEQLRSGIWLVPSNDSEAVLIQSDLDPQVFGNAIAALGSDGLGIVVTGAEDAGTQQAGTQSESDGTLPSSTLHAIQISSNNAQDPDQEPQGQERIDVQLTPTSVTVPPGTQVAGSSTGIDFDQTNPGSAVGSRSVIAWPVTATESNATAFSSTASLKASLWSNSAADFISGTETVVVGATDLVGFDDESGLLAVRYAEGGLGVLDVDAGFAELNRLPLSEGPVVFVPGQDAVVTITGTESGHALVVYDIRAGVELANQPIDTSLIGNPISLLPTDSLRSFFLVGDAGAATIRLDQPAAHDVVVRSDNDLISVNFGVDVLVENSRPSAQTEFDAAVDEDQLLTIDASEIAALVADADRDRLVSLITDPPRHGSVEVTGDGGLSYRPDENYFGSDSFAIQFHDGQSASDWLRFAVSVSSQPDAPTGFEYLGPGIPEHAIGPVGIGPLRVLDVDIGGDHDLFVADERFRIDNGELIFVSSNLDFEAQPEIILWIEGYDREAEEFIGQEIEIKIIDENDQIGDVGPLEAYVEENQAGVLVTRLYAEDQDYDQVITFTVDDSRFETVGHQLYLKSGESIDYETEPVVVLNVTADDNAGSTASAEMRVVVGDVPEAVANITLSNQTVLELEMGATVGDVQVNGVVVADSYELTVDDPRFEIDGSELKLLDDQSVRRSAAEQIELTITAQDSWGSFDAVSATFVIEVLENETPFHNDENPHDVDGNGVLSPLDALAIINYLNLYGPGPVGPGDPGFGYDVNSDGQVTTLDALLVINILNTIQNGGTVSGEGVRRDGSREGVDPDRNSVADPVSPNVDPASGSSPRGLAPMTERSETSDVFADQQELLSESNGLPEGELPASELTDRWGASGDANDGPRIGGASQSIDWTAAFDDGNQSPELTLAVDELIRLLDDSRR